jgi:DNA-directed RNA polymerase subunit F
VHHSNTNVRITQPPEPPERLSEAAALLRDDVRSILMQVERVLKYAHKAGEHPDAILTSLGELNVRYGQDVRGRPTASVDLGCLLPDDWETVSDGVANDHGHAFAYFHLCETARNGPRGRLLTEIERELLALDREGVVVTLEPELAADLKRVLRKRGLSLSAERLRTLRDAIAELRLDSSRDAATD